MVYVVSLWILKLAELYNLGKGLHSCEIHVGDANLWAAYTEFLSAQLNLNKSVGGEEYYPIPVVSI